MELGRCTDLAKRQKGAQRWQCTSLICQIRFGCVLWYCYIELLPTAMHLWGCARGLIWLYCCFMFFSFIHWSSNFTVDITGTNKAKRSRHTETQLLVTWSDNVWNPPFAYLSNTGIEDGLLGLNNFCNFLKYTNSLHECNDWLGAWRWKSKRSLNLSFKLSSAENWMDHLATISAPNFVAINPVVVVIGLSPKLSAWTRSTEVDSTFKKKSNVSVLWCWAKSENIIYPRTGSAASLVLVEINWN